MKCYKRVASAVMGMAMAASCMAPITAYAMEDTKQPTDNTAIANHPNNETMLHSTPVYRIGAKSFYKVNDDGSVVYADQDAEGYTAVPAAYIAGSQYNDGEEYGVYTTKKADGTFQMHYVKISDCQQTQGGVNWNHGTADEAKVSDDTKAEGTDTATNVCPSIHVFNSVTLLLAYYRSHIFDASRRRWMRPAAAVLCISIVCSTVLLKQHSCIDVALGALLALVLDSAFTAAERSQLPQVRRA